MATIKPQGVGQRVGYNDLIIYTADLEFQILNIVNKETGQIYNLVLIIYDGRP